MAPQFDSVRIRNLADFQLTQALNRPDCKLILLTGCSGYGKSYFLREYLKLHERYFNQNGTYFASLNAALIENSAQFEESLRSITRHYRTDLPPRRDSEATDESSPYANLQQLCVILEDVAYSPYHPSLLCAIKDLCENESLTLIVLLDEDTLLNSLEGSDRYRADVMLSTLKGMGQHLDVNASPSAFHPSCLKFVIRDIIENTVPSRFFTTTYVRDRINELQSSRTWEATERANRTFIKDMLLELADLFFEARLRQTSDFDLRNIAAAAETFSTLAPYYLITHDQKDLLTRQALGNLLICVFFELLYAHPHPDEKHSDELNLPALFTQLTSACSDYFKDRGVYDSLNLVPPATPEAENKDGIHHLFYEVTEINTDLSHNLTSFRKALDDDNHENWLINFYSPVLKALHQDFIQRFYAKATADITAPFTKDNLSTFDLTAFILICREVRNYASRGTFSCDISFALLETVHADFSEFAELPINLSPYVKMLPTQLHSADQAFFKHSSTAPHPSGKDTQSHSKKEAQVKSPASGTLDDQW